MTLTKQSCLISWVRNRTRDLPITGPMPCLLTPPRIKDPQSHNLLIHQQDYDVVAGGGGGAVGDGGPGGGSPSGGGSSTSSSSSSAPSDHLRLAGQPVEVTPEGGFR